LKDETPLDRLRSLTSELIQVGQGLSASAGGDSGGTPGAGGPGPRAEASGTAGDDDVIDADFSEE